SSMKNVMNSINSAGAKVNIYTLGENMVVTSSTTGVENSIKFEGDSAVLDALGLVQNSPDHLAAEDAKLRINGATVTSATNKVTNYIPGVTINLKKETTGAEKLTVQDQSDEKAASMITSFVNTYNALT
ncbi:flagellar filament capping protein FliD, partial [Macrococcoides canis]|uniref:flagellar filament capping protein FliD n=1 Tax=Macrococcoides canis TaxID=1855823 RepID=UPI0010E14732